MESSKEVHYVITKRKAQISNISSNENSFESNNGHLSTSLSTQGSLLSHGDMHIPIRSEPLSIFPITKARSKLLQQSISKSSPSELSETIQEMIPKISELMVDLYGNYVCQTLFHTCSADQRLLLLKALKGSFLNISLHPRGTHALQNLISMSNLKAEENIYKEEFAGKIVEMSKDPNASHVVQKLLDQLSNRYFISGEILGHVKELSLDKSGVCVVKKCCNDPEVMNEILSDALMLIQHPYGNYVVQSVLELWKEEVAFEFVSAIQGRATQLCLQKYASNVIEKAIQIENIRDSIVKEIQSEEKLKEILNNQYGSYVLRKISIECNSSQKQVFLSLINPIFEIIYSAKLQPLWKEILENLNN